VEIEKISILSGMQIVDCAECLWNTLT
jgi:hypothetical protein